jgi:transposase
VLRSIRRNTLLPALLGWATVSGYDADLLACFYPDIWPIFSSALTSVARRPIGQRRQRRQRRQRPEPNWLEVHREHKRGKHVTLQLLHLEYKAVHPDGWGYTQFCTHYRRWQARQDVVMRLEYAAGERMFVDFAGDTVPITDPATGEV